VKKIMGMVLVFVLGVTALFAATDADYRTAKKIAQEAEAAGDTGTAITNYVKAAMAAGDFKNKKGEAWQYNSAAFTLIKAFKKATAFEAKDGQLAEMTAGKKKWAVQIELATSSKEFLGLLEEAAGYLQKAEAVGLEEAAGKINSNKAYIEQIKKFIKDTLETKKEEVKETIKTEAVPAATKAK